MLKKKFKVQPRYCFSNLTCVFSQGGRPPLFPLCSLYYLLPALHWKLSWNSDPQITPWYPQLSAWCLYVEGPLFVFVEWVADSTISHTRKQVQRGWGTCLHHKTSERKRPDPRTPDSQPPALSNTQPPCLCMESLEKPSSCMLEPFLILSYISPQRGPLWECWWESEFWQVLSGSHEETEKNRQTILGCILLTQSSKTAEQNTQNSSWGLWPAGHHINLDRIH